MKNLLRHTLIAALLGSTLCTPVLAQTRYISDTLGVPMRTGPSNQYRIVDLNLRSGTPLTVLEFNAGEDFSKVRLNDGREGFVRTQYLQHQPGAKRKLAALEKRHQQLMSQSKSQTQELAEMKQQLGATQQSETSLSKRASSLDKELTRIKTVAADSLALADRNEALIKEVLQLKQEKETLQLEKQRLEDSQAQRWFLYGGGTILGGIALGLILPLLKFRRRRQSEWI